MIGLKPVRGSPARLGTRLSSHGADANHMDAKAAIVVTMSIHEGFHCWGTAVHLCVVV